MALKDWELLFKDPDEIVWVKHGVRLSVYQLHKITGQIRRWVITDKELDRKPLKQVITKQAALKFAKSYMRTH